MPPELEWMFAHNDQYDLQTVELAVNDAEQDCKTQQTITILLTCFVMLLRENLEV